MNIADMKDNMFYGANAAIFARAQELRNRITPAEETLWKLIHINEWKLKFRRQHPIANYVVDFYCHSKKLVIELDGGVHEVEDVKRYDEIRQTHLNELGLTVLRFKNSEIFNDINSVLKKILDTINSITNPPVEIEVSGNRVPNSPLGDGGKLVVIKIGGNIIDDEAKLSSFLEDFAVIEGRKILVHGGGKLATKLAEKLGVQQQMIEGRRITDAETLKIVTMVYAGAINKNIVAQLQANNCNAIGLCGADGNVIKAHKRVHPTIDYGFVGDVDAVNTGLLKSLLDQNIAVVLAPITQDGKGQLLNTNADTIAQETAKALSSLYQVDLIYSFEKSGVLLNADDDSTVIKTINPASYKELKEKQVIFAGMIPKLDNAFAALDSGVARVIIGKAEQLHSILEGKSGTTISHE